MRVLSLMIICSLLFLSLKIGHPHGPNFKISCSICHSAKGWQLDKEIYSFDHNATKLPLSGQHRTIDCRLCHTTLVFSDVKTECSDCHTDIHQATVGPDCARCHTPQSWLVNNINELHQVSRFPLLGAHRTADCFDCHKSESLARFDVQGINCINCHSLDYLATANPNHSEAGFSEDCSVCHPINAFQWTGAGFNHDFFALIQGHAVPECSDCHKSGSYSDTSPECNSCHQQDFLAASNPNHTASGFATTCLICHSLSPDWKPASFIQHDSQLFPIYSGSHNGQWDSCTQCHTDQSDYTKFSCITCHEHNKAEMDDKHSGEDGYLYDSASCFRCHPRGNAD